MTTALTLSSPVAPQPHAAATDARPTRAASTTTGAGGKSQGSPQDIDRTGAAEGADVATSAWHGNRTGTQGSFGAALEQSRARTATRLEATDSSKTPATGTPAATSKAHADEDMPTDDLLLTAWMGPSLEAARLASSLAPPASGTQASATIAAASAADAAARRSALERDGTSAAAVTSETATAATDTAVTQTLAALAALDSQADQQLRNAAGGGPDKGVAPARLEGKDAALLQHTPAAGDTPRPALAARQLKGEPSAAQATDDAQTASTPVATASIATTPLPVSAVTARASKGESAGDMDADAATAPPVAPGGAASTAQASNAGAGMETVVRAAIAAPVGSDAWAPALGQHMIRIAAKGDHVAELDLNPIGLGPLKVRLSVTDNQAQAMFMSGHESVRQAVEAAMPQLRTTLASQGISLGQTSVGADPGQAFFAGTGSGEQRNPTPPSRTSALDSTNATTQAPLIEAPPVMQVLRNGAGFTTFA
ncbi:flagellar hook-length control protein FliK [Variovorax ginsengisoli]|uniref:Flagellar hook-length control protein FliK n=1 Tax=Variovorax ginsengisoli TaxID=363844 RepID=A0ABT9SD67_9BURK|nr:flagellar hook-length control protein FliK [Variovorax ginsengisoli]MDP9902295.1 flagellar hook-length control protein FliK [Variovorax ginsengisoli]